MKHAARIAEVQMIPLTRLNGQEIALNCDLIESVEATPDTTVRMISGHSILVLEPVGEVRRRIVAYRAEVLSAGGIAALLSGGEPPTPTMIEATLAGVGDDELRTWSSRRELRRGDS